MSVSRWGPPSLKSSSTRALAEEGSRETETLLVVLPGLESRQWGDFCSVKWVEGCRSHGSPCGGPAYTVPWLICSPPPGEDSAGLQLGVRWEVEPVQR